MQINEKQMEAFSAEALGEFEERLTDFLRDEFPDAQEVPREELLPDVHEQVGKARSYSLETEQQIANYVTTAWLLGQQFDTEFSAAKEMLTSSEYSANDKAQWMVQWTTEMFAALEENDDVLG